MEQANRMRQELEKHVQQLQDENKALQIEIDRHHIRPVDLRGLWTSDELRAKQLTDSTIGPVCAARVLGQPLPESTYIQSRPKKERVLWQHWNELECEEGTVIFRRYLEGQTPGAAVDKVLVLPEDCRGVAFQQAHFLKSDVHLPFMATLGRLCHQVYWPLMEEDVYKWMKGCEWCRVIYPLPDWSIPDDS